MKQREKQLLIDAWNDGFSSAEIAISKMLNLAPSEIFTGKQVRDKMIEQFLKILEN